MYQTSDDVAAAILGYSRTWRIRLEEIGGDIVIGGDEITQANSEHTSTSLPDDIELGAVCSQYWLVKTSRQGNYVGKKFKLYFYLLDLNESRATWGDLESYTAAELSEMSISEIEEMHQRIGEPIPMGVFTCVKSPRTGDGRELHLYDALYFTDKPYSSMVNLPARASAIETDICNQLGIGNAVDYDTGGYLVDKNTSFMQETGGGFLFTAPFDFMVEEIPEGTTIRQMLGYIASLNSQYGCIDRLGRYTRRWYAPDSMTTIDNDHADEPTISETANTVVGIRCTVGDEELTAGSMTGGRVLEFENPFMTTTYIRSLFVKVRGTTWYTSQLAERLGDPRHDIGDTVTIQSEGEEYDIPITMIQFSFDGGLLANISSAGLTDEEQSI